MRSLLDLWYPRRPRQAVPTLIHCNDPRELRYWQKRARQIRYDRSEKGKAFARTVFHRPGRKEQISAWRIAHRRQVTDADYRNRVRRRARKIAEQTERGST